MNLDGLTSAFTLSSLSVSPNELLLDPRNPRLITESVQDRSYTTEQIQSAVTQEFVRNLVCSKEHDVKRLIASIREMGFVGGIHEMIVKDIGSGGPYLVIEGNRRTAAMQYLLRSAEKLRSDVRKSIEVIRVKELVYRKNHELSEDKVIDVLLGSIHIDGPKEWGALERAHYVHRSYMRVFGDRRSFRYDPAVAKDVGSTFKMSPQEVHKYLKICRVYEQLRGANVGIEPKHYTLIDLATKTRDVAGPYFELDSETCELSDVGLERFVQLMLGKKPLIHNPKLFDKFVKVYTDGRYLELVVSGDVCLEDALIGVEIRKKRREFQEDLDDIKRRIGDLYVDGFQNTEGEKALILQIKHLVDTRLVPLGRARS